MSFEDLPLGKLGLNWFHFFYGSNEEFFKFSGFFLFATKQLQNLKNFHLYSFQRPIEASVCKNILSYFIFLMCNFLTTVTATDNFLTFFYFDLLK